MIHRKKVMRNQIREFPFDCIVQKLATLSWMTNSRILTCVCFYSNLSCQTIFFLSSVRFVALLYTDVVFFLHFFYILVPCDNSVAYRMSMSIHIHAKNLIPLQDVTSFSIQHNHIRAILILCIVIFVWYCIGVYCSVY